MLCPSPASPSRGHGRRHLQPCFGRTGSWGPPASLAEAVSLGSRDPVSQRKELGTLPWFLQVCMYTHSHKLTQNDEHLKLKATTLRNLTGKASWPNFSDMTLRQVTTGKKYKSFPLSILKTSYIKEHYVKSEKTWEGVLQVTADSHPEK